VQRACPARRQSAEHAGAGPPKRRGGERESPGAAEHAARADAAAAAREAALAERERSLAAQVRGGEQQASLISNSQTARTLHEQ